MAYPTVALGTDRFWGAVRGVIVAGDPSGILPGRRLVGVVAGAAVGDPITILPEVYAYVGNETILGAGVSVQYDWSRDRQGF